MSSLTHNKLSIPADMHGDSEPLLSYEWLVTNGLGGYASGSVTGVITRRYHGLLVAALPTPFGRTVMLTHLQEEVRLPDGEVARLTDELLTPDRLYGGGWGRLKEFRLEAGLPVWRYEIGDTVLVKRVLMTHRQNTTFVSYRLLAGTGPVRLRLRPWLHIRPHEGPVSEPLRKPYTVMGSGDRYEILPESGGLTSLRLKLYGERGSLVLDGGHFQEVFYQVEQSRGYDAYGVLDSPGYFRANMAEDGETTLVLSTEEWDSILALSPEAALRAELERRQRLLTSSHPRARTGTGAELALSADQFIITPSSRLADTARARAAGDEVRSVIAGYHWFTDWGRDTMIALEGLTLITGRHQEAGYILRTFSYYVRDGLLPNMFPEGEKEGLYHTADASLWYFHALDRYLHHTDDRMTLRLLLPTLVSMIEHHLHGTRFGIHVDAQDGLLSQGEAGYQLTWMDAKVDDWVVTPRRGKAVEINALWYNALRLLERWLREEHGSEAARPYEEQARRAYESFNTRFWNEAAGYLYDVVDAVDGGNDPALRPNQILAISLPHPVLAPERWPRVMEVVRERLLTPVGLRSRAPGEHDYRPRYDGDLRSRDAAYHQGTVWAWLIGPFIDAWLKLHPDDKGEARSFLLGFVPHLNEACIGSISEIFDAEKPFAPRGCVAQAWSVAEVLRAWVKTAE